MDKLEGVAPATPKMPPSLTQLPSEVLHNILIYLDPKDIGILPRVCRYFNNYLSNNGPLCRDIYLRLLDHPATRQLDWVQEIHDLAKLKAVCASAEVDKNELPFVFNTVRRLLGHATRDKDAERRIRSVTYARSQNVDLLTSLFDRESIKDAFLAQSSLFARARGHGSNSLRTPKEEYQQSAQLHCLYGVPLLKYGRTRSSRMYPFACSRVYDIRQYTEESRWGPFMADGSDKVDWEKVEAILMVLGNNIKERGLDKYPIFSNFWSTPFAGAWPGSYVRWPPPGEQPEQNEQGAELSSEDEAALEEARKSRQLQLDDPYDVSGTWMRVVCFLDYNDFFRFNFPTEDELPDNVPRQALDTDEATRVILMKVHVTKIEYAPGESAETGGWPVVEFKGFSRSLDASWDENAHSALRGVVRMTPEGEVRWTTFSIFEGVERWRSESVQIGGAKSAKGVIGNWFDRDYDPHGPCGPTAFWKISDHEPKNDDLQVLRDDFLRIVDGDDDDMHAYDLGQIEEDEDEDEDDEDDVDYDDGMDDHEGFFDEDDQTDFLIEQHILVAPVIYGIEEEPDHDFD